MNGPGERILCPLAIGLLAVGRLLAAEPDIPTLLERTGITAGLVVLVGSRDGATETALARAGAGNLLVQGIGTDRTAVAAARERIARDGWYGYASVTWVPDLRRLPYNDRLANLVIADLDAAGAPTRSEVMRIVAPFGNAWIREAGAWKRVEQPLPDGMDEWTHFNRGADGNPQSRDAVVGAPRGVQWFSSSIANMGNATHRLAGGRMYLAGSITARFKDRIAQLFVARDAANGLPLWDRPSDSARPPIRPEMERITVADRDRVIGLIGTGGFARAVDGRTGVDLLVYVQGLAAPLKADGRRYQLLQALVPGRLVQAIESEVVALDPRSGVRQWVWRAQDGRHAAWLAVGDDTAVVALSSARSGSEYSYNNWFWRVDAVVALDLATGRQRWLTTLTRPMASFGTVIAEGGAFLIDSAVIDLHQRRRPYGDLIRLDLRDGRESFRLDIGALEPDDRFWHNQLRVHDGTIYPGFGWIVRGVDARTGQPRPRIAINAPHLRSEIGFCSQVRGTARGQLSGTFPTFVDFASGEVTYFPASRAGCDVANFPAYGMVYTGSSGCGCTQYLRGMLALQCSQEEVRAPVPDADRLERGMPAPTGTTAPDALDWPQLLGDATRAARAGAQLTIAAGAVPTRRFALPLPERRGLLGTEWWRANARLGPITPPVVAGDRMVVAVVDSHEVHGVDARSGEPRWLHRAGGRVTSSPTLWRGLVLFGARDGTVTALRASDGALVWRFLAAPERRAIVVDGQLESVWPVHGAVLVHEGKAYVAAGRNTVADGGIRLWRLDAATGAIEARGIIDHRATSDGGPTPFCQTDQGVSCDVLTLNARGTLIGMGYIVIDPATLDWANLQTIVSSPERATVAGRPNPFHRPREDFFPGRAPDVGRDTPGLMHFINAPATGLVDRRAGQAGTKGQNAYRFGAVRAYETQYRGNRLVRDGTTIYAVNPDGIAVFRHDADWKPVGALDKRGMAAGERIATRVAEMYEGALLAGDRLVFAGDRTITMVGIDGGSPATITAPARLIMHGLVAAGGRLLVAMEDGTIATYEGGGDHHPAGSADDRAQPDRRVRP